MDDISIKIGVNENNQFKIVSNGRQDFIDLFPKNGLDWSSRFKKNSYLDTGHE